MHAAHHYTSFAVASTPHRCSLETENYGNCIMTTLFSLHLQSYAVNANGGEVVISSIAQKTVHVHLDATDEMT